MSKRSRRPSQSQRPPQLAAALPATPAATHDAGVPPHIPKEERLPHVLVALALTALCAALYAWTVDFPMVFDDDSYLKDNPLFKDASGFSYTSGLEEFLRRPKQMGFDPDLAVNFIMRPAAYASFYLNYLIDGFNPRWFRVVNIIIHLLNSWLVYLLLSRLLGMAASRDGASSGPHHLISIVPALLFAVHPLAIESVTYIVQRFTSLVVLFSLLALWLHFSAIAIPAGWRRWRWHGMSVISLLLAMQTKECAFTVPFLAVLLHLLVLETSMRAALVRSLPLLLCAPLVPLLVVLITYAEHGGFPGFSSMLNIVNSRDAPLGHADYAITQITVLVHYLRLLLWPAGQNLDPQWPLHHSFWTWPVISSSLILAGLVSLAVWLHLRFRGEVRHSLGFVGVLWFFITISVSSGIVPLPDLVAEHRSYLPSIGIFIFLACLFDWSWDALSRRPAARTLALMLGVAGLCSLAWATCARNQVWRTSQSLWEDTVAKSPGKFRAWSNLGVAHSLKGDYEKAVECYRASVKIEPRFQTGLLNLSNSLLMLNRPQESLTVTHELIRVDGSRHLRQPVAFTLGLGLASIGDYDKAAEIFQGILQTSPDDVQTLMALGLVYLKTGQPLRALEHLRHAERLQPDAPQLQTMLRVTSEALASSGLH